MWREVVRSLVMADFLKLCSWWRSPEYSVLVAVTSEHQVQKDIAAYGGPSGVLKSNIYKTALS